MFQGNKIRKVKMDVNFMNCGWKEEKCLLLLFNNLDNKLKLERLKKLDAYKDKVLANVSHDLRTPIIGIQGMLKQALSTEDKTEITSMLEASIDSSELMLAMIHDILDFYSI